MMKTRQKAGRGLIKQGMSGALGETSSDINVSVMPFPLSQSSATCLPVVSDSQRILWIHSNQMEQQLNGEEELEKAFNRFPYLTQKETAALAHHCSLHPDQVKVWFMGQRLRFGISWDYKDILNVRRQFKANQVEEELPETRGKEVKADDKEKKTWNREVKEPEAGEVQGATRREKNKNEERMVEGKVRADEQMQREVKLEHQMKKENDAKVKEDKKRMNVKGQRGEKRKYRGWGDEAMSCTSFDKPPLKRDELSSTTNSVMSLGNMGAKQEAELLAESKNPDVTVTDVKKLQELIDGSITENACILPTETSYYEKTNAQVAMLRRAFLHCQYPDKDEYGQLSRLTGLSRPVLIQWFGDTRYHIKRGKTRWMSKEQHSQLVANVMYRQHLKTLAKKQPIERGQRKMEKNAMLRVSEGCGEERSEQDPAGSK